MLLPRPSAAFVLICIQTHTVVSNLMAEKLHLAAIASYNLVRSALKSPGYLSLVDDGN